MPNKPTGELGPQSDPTPPGCEELGLRSRRLQGAGESKGRKPNSGPRFLRLATNAARLRSNGPRGASGSSREFHGYPWWGRGTDIFQKTERSWGNYLDFTQPCTQCWKLSDIVVLMGGGMFSLFSPLWSGPLCFYCSGEYNQITDDKWGQLYEPFEKFANLAPRVAGSWN